MQPIIPMYIFKIWNIAFGMPATFINGYIFYWQLFGVPQFFQVVRGDSPIRSGVLLLALIVPQVVVSALAGNVVSRTGRFKEIIVCGWVVRLMGHCIQESVKPLLNLQTAALHHLAGRLLDRRRRVQHGHDCRTPPFHVYRSRPDVSDQ